MLDADGNEIGVDDFQTSRAGTPGDNSADASIPDVAWNSVTNQYIVTWDANVTPRDTDVYGQLLDADGSEIGVNDFRVSDAAGVDVAGDSALDSRVAVNSQNGDYFVRRGRVQHRTEQSVRFQQ